MENLESIQVKKKTGNESFSFSGISLEHKLIDFWQWNCSDLVSNSLRGILAEYIVTTMIPCKSEVRTEWDSYDILTENNIKIEVKSSGYIQSWKQKKYSNISFGIQPTRGWDSETNIISNKIVRQSDIYIFCLFAHKNKNTVNPLNLNQWDFFVIETETLNKLVPKQKNISLSKLKNLNPFEGNYKEASIFLNQLIKAHGGNKN